MRKTKFLASIVVSVFLVSACLDVDMKIKVKPDGSGTIEEHVLLSNDVVDMLSSFGEVDSEGNKETFEIYNEEELRSKAIEIGEGAKFIGGEKISADGKQGYRAVYEFPDITKIRVNQSPDSKLPEGTVDDGESDENGEFITFNFSKGNPAILKINLPGMEEPEAKGGDEEQIESDSLNSGGMEEMFIEMMKDFRMNMEVEIEGDIVETNAAFRDGSKITLLLMDFKKLFEMPEKLKEFKKLKPNSYKKAEKFFHDIPGFKIELKETVNVKLK